MHGKSATLPALPCASTSPLTNDTTAYILSHHRLPRLNLLFVYCVSCTNILTFLNDVIYLVFRGLEIYSDIGRVSAVHMKQKHLIISTFGSGPLVVVHNLVYSLSIMYVQVVC